MDKTIKLTKQGLKDLEAELEERTTITRSKIADEIDKARQQGDLSENAAYKAAIESNEFNETKISKLEEMLKYAVVEDYSNKSGINIGSKVKLKNVDRGVEQEFEIVGQNESDPVSKKISIKSPIGAALKGKNEGDDVVVQLPAGQVKYKIVKVS